MPTQVIESEGNLHSHLDRLQIEDGHQQKILRLFASLRFDGMYERRKFVQQRVDGYDETCRWILEPDRSRGFHKWLRSGRGLYWISGKPGSGKSSLLNYIFKESVPGANSHSLLGEWSSADPVKVLSFFFSRLATDPLQKSFEALW